MITVELVHHEIFVGDETGATDITLLKQWLEEIDRQPVYCGFPIWNAAELLASHEFDKDYMTRCKHLGDLLIQRKDLKERAMPPLIVASDKPKFESSARVWVIDGWHRLSMLHMMAEYHKSNVVPFWAHWVHLSELKQFVPAPGIVHNRDKFEHEVKRGIKV